MLLDVENKQRIGAFWNEQSCGEVYATGSSDQEYYSTHSAARYALEPYLVEFARFTDGRNKDVLEVGVGMGADHCEWARSKPRSLSGIDLTQRSIDHTRRRLAAAGLRSDVRVADAEQLPFEDESFDIAYSWGVIHHTPTPALAVNEIHRVLRPNGIARIMIYHKYSLTGYVLWMRYALLAGRPTRSLSDVYANHLESPGTKAYSVDEARAMFARFSSVKIGTQLCFGDLLQGEAGQRHQGALLAVAKKLWPRWLIRRIFANHGLDLLIEAVK
jgi:ubiquinone/menaquinone biosynthesis C-methylase UbiE